MSRALHGLALIALGFPLPLAAQEALGAQTGSPPERIDLLAEAADAAQNPPDQDCEPDTGFGPEPTIVVCGQRYDPAAAGYDKRSAQERYAARTMYRNDPQPPDVAGAGIFRGPATVGNLCIPGLQKCPPPPAYMIDFASLPDAPPGSDADRIARGLPPLGQTPGTAVAATQPADQQSLGLPPAPSPSGSASPAAAPSG